MQLHTVNDVGAAVRDARVRRRLTQADLARRAGVSREWLVRLEHGHPRLEMQLVLDTLAALDLALTASEGEPLDTSHHTTWDDVLTDLTDTKAVPADASSRSQSEAGQPDGRDDESNENG